MSVNIDYWIGITECDCHSEHPTGGCLRCDLEELKREIARLTQDRAEALDGLLNAREFICRWDEMDEGEIEASKALSNLITKLETEEEV